MRAIPVARRRARQTLVAASMPSLPRPRPKGIRGSLSTNRHDFCMSFDNDQNFTESADPRPRLVEGGRGLVVTRIGKRFKKRPVVRSVSLNVRRGEVVGLLGPNGAGKTTCFYLISGLIHADTGTIEVGGHDVT